MREPHFNPTPLIQQVRETIARAGLLLPDDLVIVGVSGGPDSLCLLHILRQLANDYPMRLHVAHLHHGLRGQAADEDARFVAEICLAWGLPCTVEYADVPALAQTRGVAIEEAARQARYRFLGTCARRLGGQTVAVAHNADDQVETVLMHLLRGSGLAGLRGMRPLAWLDELHLGKDVGAHGCVPLPRIRLVRPLLCISRQEIEAYCRAQALQPRYDLSNLDQTYYRNRLRHELLPLLETYNPAIRQILGRTAEALAADYDWLRQQLEVAWQQVVRSISKEAIVYDLATLRALPLSQQRSILREGIHRLRRSLRNINWVHVDDALEILQGRTTGCVATLPQGLALTVEYDTAILAAKGYYPPADERPRLYGGPYALNTPGNLELPGPATQPSPMRSWVITVQVIAASNLPADWEHNPDPYTAYLDATCCAAPLALRQRQEGDWLVPLGLNHRQKLRDLMINAKIPRHERATVPLLVCGADIIWVVGWRVDARYAVRAETSEVLILRVSAGNRDRSFRDIQAPGNVAHDG